MYHGALCLQKKSERIVVAAVRFNKRKHEGGAESPEPESNQWPIDDKNLYSQSLYQLSYQEMSFANSAAIQPI